MASRRITASRAIDLIFVSDDYDGTAVSRPSSNDADRYADAGVVSLLALMVN